MLGRSGEPFALETPRELGASLEITSVEGTDRASTAFGVRVYSSLPPAVRGFSLGSDPVLSPPLFVIGVRPRMQ